MGGPTKERTTIHSEVPSPPPPPESPIWLYIYNGAMPRGRRTDPCPPPSGLIPARPQASGSLPVPKRTELQDERLYQQYELCGLAVAAGRVEAAAAGRACCATRLPPANTRGCSSGTRGCSSPPDPPANTRGSRPAWPGYSSGTRGCSSLPDPPANTRGSRRATRPAPRPWETSTTNKLTRTREWIPSSPNVGLT